MKPILECSAFELADQIRTKQRSSLEIVEAHIEEIQRWNSELNALVQDNFAEARHEAIACDEKLKSSDFDVTKFPPLFGVPYTMKEMVTVSGFKHTLGSVHRREALADRDASVVERLRNAGAILLGTTNVPELGFWFECANPIYGRTNNPYDLSRTSGGSSGGEAALIGAGASPFGIGSDIGGSIRMPAAFCGIFGHKPSRHVVPLTGHFPLYFENASDWSGEKYPLTVLGPMSRRASDLYPLMQLLIGPDGFDQEIKKDFKLGERVTDWSSKTVWVMPSPRIRGVGLTDTELRDSVSVAAGYFEAMGAKIKTMREDLFKDAVLLWFASLSRAKERSFTEILSDGKEINFAREFLKIAFSRGDYTLPALGASLLETFSRKNEENLEHKRLESLAQLDRLKSEFNHLLGDDSILILPVHPRVAPQHYAPLLRPFDYAMTAIFNSLETPATSVPMGLDEGLPLAVQIVAGEYQDHLTLSAAETLETAFGGWQAPPALR